MSINPQFVDMNSDGIKDILVAGYCGKTFIIWGKSDGSWETPEAIKDVDGEFVSMGMVQDEKTGRLERVKDPYINANSVKVVDWDKDGDLDILMSAHFAAGYGSNWASGMYLCLNIGNKKNPKFSSKIERVITTFHLVVNEIVDYDGDGLFDIICTSSGTKEVGIYYYKNLGKKKKPLFKEPKKLYSVDQLEKFSRYKPHSLYVNFTDYNKDGIKDFVVSGRGEKIYKDPTILAEIDAVNKLTHEVGDLQKQRRDRLGFIKKKYTDPEEANIIMSEDKELRKIDDKLVLLNNELDTKKKYKKNFPHIFVINLK